MIENKKIKDIALKAYEAIQNKNLIGNEDADKYIENLIFNELKALNEELKIVSEEYGTLIIGKPKTTIIVDPIDGTGNLIRGIPIYSVAMAICEGCLNEVAVDDIRYSVVVSVFGIFESSHDDIDKINECTSIEVKEALLRSIRPFRMRMFGASTVELCLMSKGGLDGFIELKGLKCVDLIPVLLILKKNGCFFSDKDGKEVVFKLDKPKLNQYSFIAARTKRLHEELIKMVKGEDLNG